MDKMQSYKKLVRNLRLQAEQKDLIRQKNFTKKSIKEFTQEDTIYLRKMVKGYSHFILCSFLSFEKGVVTGLPIVVDPEFVTKSYIINGTPIAELKSRLKSCCLRDASGVCYWFNRNGFTE